MAYILKQLNKTYKLIKKHQNKIKHVKCDKLVKLYKYLVPSMNCRTTILEKILEFLNYK